MSGQITEVEKNFHRYYKDWMGVLPVQPINVPLYTIGTDVFSLGMRGPYHRYVQFPIDTFTYRKRRKKVETVPNVQGNTIETLPTLYKADSKGKTREWLCEVVDYPTLNWTQIQITHGLHGAKQAMKVTTVKVGKNIGRANETSRQEQAISEARSKWNKQKDKGYIENMTAVVQFKATKLLPMLAHRYDQHAAKIRFPAFAQPKLDGIRCLGIRGGLISRKAKPFTSLPHIQADVDAIHQLTKLNALDGELYSHKLTFQEITSAVRKHDPVVNYEYIEYHVYDCVTLDGVDYSERFDMLTDFCGGFKSIKIVQTKLVQDEQELMDFVRECVKRGFEGGIVRNMSGVYQLDKRSYNLQKIKEFQDGEFSIVAGKEDKDGGCVFTCECGNSSFDVRPEGTIEQRKQYWEELPDLLGKKLTVRYFGMTTSVNPVPRFPVGVAIRDYE